MTWRAPTGGWCWLPLAPRQGCQDFDAATGDATDVEHEISTMDTLDSAARKLGGDPTKDLYGAPEY